MSNHKSLLLLALLASWWYFYGRKKVTPATTTSPEPIAQPTTEPEPTIAVEPQYVPPTESTIGPTEPAATVIFEGQGTGFQSGYGYAQGDRADLAIDNLSYQSKWFLARQYYDRSGISIWDKWRQVRKTEGYQKEDVRARIDQAFVGYNGLVDSMQSPVPESFYAIADDL